MSAPHIPIEEIARFPRPGTSGPVGWGYRKDGALLAYLASPEGDLAQVLHGHDVETGESRVIAEPTTAAGEDDLSLEEKLRRERLRQRAVGITSYAFDKDGERVLVPVAGGIFVLDEPGSPLRELVSAKDGTCIDATFSPRGDTVAFVRDAEVHVVATAGGAPRAITAGARAKGFTHGLAEFVAQEEMGRLRGFWWAPDGDRIAFTEVDESHIPAYRITHQGKAAVGAGAEEDHRYPFAGARNAIVRLAVVPIAGGDPVWMDLGDDEDIYLARVHWLTDGSLAAEILDRRQETLRLVRFDGATGAATELLRETSDVWVNLHRCFRALKKGEGELTGGFVWASERTGFRHLELRAADGSLVRVLTSGEWMIDALMAVDEDGGAAYVLGTREGATTCHLYRVPLAGGEPVRLTPDDGSHMVAVSPAFDTFVDRHHAVDRPIRCDLRNLADGSLIRTLHDAHDARVDDMALTPPELLTIENRDGIALDAALYRPEGDGPWPLVVSVYGGPHAQRVKNDWLMTIDLRAQALARRGYLVLVCDNRGAARHGLAFEGWIKHDMGNLEVLDQVDAVRWCVDQGLADPDRVAIYGWSYGGYMSAMCLARAPDTFKAAVAGAPVTSWDGYDTCYTERYMGLPQENADGYQRADVMHHVEGIRGRLLLVHGLIDENVHFRHTARLIQSLIRARKPYELLLFPDERHMPRGEADRIYMEERIFAFLEEALEHDTK